MASSDLPPTFAGIEIARFDGSRSPRRGVNPLLLAWVFAVLAGLGHLGQAQEQVTVRFLDFRSGKPIDNLQVFLTFWNGGQRLGGKMVPTKNDVVREVLTTTDKHGRVTTEVPQPTPEHLDTFSFDLAYSFNHDFAPAVVVTSGAVVIPRREKGNSKLQIAAKPGEIVILNKRLTVVDRMRREIP